MFKNNQIDLSKSKNPEKIRKFLVLFSLIIILILFFFLTIFLYFLPYYKEVKSAYDSCDYLLVGTIIMVVRIVVLIALGYILFKKWILHEESHYTDIPFLLGIFSYIFIFGKVLDIIGYSIYVDIKFIGNFSELLLLNLSKIRVVIAIVNMFPIFLIGIYFYFFRRSLRKEESQKEMNARKNTTIFLFVFYSSLLILLLLLNNIQYLSLLSGISALSGFSLLIWVFITAHNGKILPEIRSLTISIGFVLLLFFNVLFSIMIVLFSDLSLLNITLVNIIVESGVIILYTSEGGNLVATIIILIGFKKKRQHQEYFNNNT